MPFVKGQPKMGGRKKGVLNKDALPLREIAQKLDVDPFEILLKFAKEDWEGLGYPSRSKISYTSAGIEYEEYLIKPEMRVKAASEACQYIHAKRKAIESTVDPALLDLLKTMENKSEEELLAIINQDELG